MIPRSAYITQHVPEMERQSFKLGPRFESILFQKHMKQISTKNKIYKTWKHETEAYILGSEIEAYIRDRSMIGFGRNSISSRRGGSLAEQRKGPFLRATLLQARLKHRTNPPAPHMDSAVVSAKRFRHDTIQYKTMV